MGMLEGRGMAAKAAIGSEEEAFCQLARRPFP